jgi:glucokinase
MIDLVLALDFGGTKHAAAVVARGERAWRVRRQVLAPPGADAAWDLQAMRSLAREVLAGQTPVAVGVSFGGPVDFATGIVRLSHHVPGWEDRTLAALLQAEFGARVSVDNDANVAALGELRYGAGQGCRSLLYITVSTGVGGGWILDGRPWRGHENMAGEIGHMQVDPTGPECVCGSRGCVERLAAGPHIAARARALLAARPLAPSALRAVATEALDARAVAEAAEAGDTVAWEALAPSAEALGAGIANAANLVNPERFVLGGGVTKAGPRWWAHLLATARARAMPQVHFDIVQAALGDDAPLWGAVALTELT